MRTTLFIAGTCFLIISCNQKQPSSTISKPVSDVAVENLKGNVAQVEIDTYLIDSTGKTGPLDDKYIEKFDSTGYTVSNVDMNGKDSIKSQTTLQRNGNGYVIAVQTTGANNVKKSSLTIECDSLGKYSFAKSYDSTGKMDSYYDDLITNKFGEIVGGKQHHLDSTLKMSFLSDFDSIYYIGNITKDSVGKITYSGKQTLNDKKDIIKMDETTVTLDAKTKKDSTKNTITTYTYAGSDSNGNWTQQTTFNDKGKPTKMAKRVINYRQ